MIRRIAQLLAPDSAGGSTAIAPAPTAPAPAPTPAPKPSSPTPGAAPTDDPFSKLDARTAPKPKETKPEPKDDKTPKDKVEPKPDANKEGKSFTEPKQLRTAYDSLKVEHEALKAKLTHAEEGTKKHADLAARVAAVEKERDAAKAELGIARFQASEEFVKLHEKPFKQSADYARRLVEGLTIQQTDELGEKTGERPAKWEDFAALYQLPLNKAIQVAKANFGDSAPIVIEQLTKLQGLDFTRAEALKEEQAAWQSRQQEDLANQTKMEEAKENMWRTVNQDIAERHPEWSADPKNDEEKELLNESFQLADAYFSHGGNMPLQSRIVHAANIRHRAATQPLFVYRLNAANARVAELQKVIEEMKGSGPGTTIRPTSGADTTKSTDDWRKALRSEVPETPGG